jgi:hypothetical protein
MGLDKNDIPELISLVVEYTETDRREQVKKLEAKAKKEPNSEEIQKALEAVKKDYDPSKPVYKTAELNKVKSGGEGLSEEEASVLIAEQIEWVEPESVLPIIRKYSIAKLDLKDTQLREERLLKYIPSVTRYQKIKDLTKEPIIHRLVSEAWGNRIVQNLSYKFGQHERMSLDRFLLYVTQVHETIKGATGECRFSYDIEISDGKKPRYETLDEVMEILEKEHRGPVTRFSGEIVLENEQISATIKNLTPYGRIPAKMIPGLSSVKRLKGKALELPKGRESENLRWAGKGLLIVGIGAIISQIGAGSLWALPAAAGLALYANMNHEWSRGYSVGAITQLKPVEDTTHKYSENDVCRITSMMETLRSNKYSIV